MSELPRDPVTPQARVIAWLLIVVGALMTLLCGACTLTLLGVSIASSVRSPAMTAELAPAFLLYGVVGGLPTLGGMVLLWAGWRILRPRATARSVSKTFE